MSFRTLKLKKEYRSLLDNVVAEFYIPVLQESIIYKRAVGFFSSSALVELTRGIAGLVRNDGKILLIASPYLSQDDIRAINEGYRKRDSVIEACLMRSLTEPCNTNEIKRLNLLSNLIASNILEIKIAFLVNNNSIGMFHEKMGVMCDNDDNIIAFTGSMNESANAFSNNYESIDVFCSWENETERVSTKKKAFEAMWDNLDPHIETIEFPYINDLIIEKYQTDNNLDLDIDRNHLMNISKRALNNRLLNIPIGTQLRDYQLEAIEEWKRQNFRGIYDMATGTGKTYTALGSLECLETAMSNIAVFIVCPYIHLVSQWEEDVLDWGALPIVAHSQSDNKKWYQSLIAAYKRFKNTGKSFICIMTNATFRDDRIQGIVSNISADMKVVLLIDEVHNFGAENLSQLLKYNFQFRLGLSATVERHMDSIGTERILNYFGKKCIEYPLEKAILNKSLVEYEYFPIIVSLNDIELEQYQRMTKQIQQCLITEEGKTKISEIGQQIIFKRSRLIAGAEKKLTKLREIMQTYVDDKYILVYCGATRGFEEYPGEKERQIDRVEKIIGKELGMTTHRFTSEEDIETRRLLKEGFADGEYQALTAIKCLDEGVNIPNIQIAFILASSRNPKEFIQRRGRVLRNARGKSRATIYDFVTLPRSLNNIRFGDFESDRSIIIGEMARVYEFGRYSVNSRIADDLIDEIQAAYSIDVLKEDLSNLMEVDYGEV